MLFLTSLKKIFNRKQPTRDAQIESAIFLHDRARAEFRTFCVWLGRAGALTYTAAQYMQDLQDLHDTGVDWHTERWKFDAAIETTRSMYDEYQALLHQLTYIGRLLDFADETMKGVPPHDQSS